jgi:hypothetical protein
MMAMKRLFAVFFAAALLCSAQTKFPDTPAAYQFSAWLDAFNSGDRAVLLEYLQRNNPSHAADINQEFGFRNQTGGFDFKKVEESAPRGSRALSKSGPLTNSLASPSKSSPPSLIALKSWICEPFRHPRNFPCRA